MDGVIKKTIKAVEAIMAGMIAVVVVIIAVQVVFRYAFKMPLTWTEQTARYLFV